MPKRLTLKHIFEENIDQLDKALIRPDGLAAIERMLKCRTAQLGAEVYESENGERLLVYHTCKSRACSSCGVWRTICWQRQVKSWLPDVHYAMSLLTMPSVLWPLFQNNRNLIGHLAKFAAGVHQDWAAEKYDADILVLTAIHTFGGDLGFKPHVHVLVSTTGLRKSGKRLVHDIRFPRDVIVPRWRDAVMDFLIGAWEAGQLSSACSDAELVQTFKDCCGWWWKGGTRYGVQKGPSVDYLCSYFSRPPLANHRLLPQTDREEVHFMAKMTKQGGEYKPMVMPIREFLGLVIDHIPDHYSHRLGYFGLIAPRSKGRSFRAFLALLGQRERPRPRRPYWAASIQEKFGRNPLDDSTGKPMKKVGRLAPVKPDQDPI